MPDPPPGPGTPTQGDADFDFDDFDFDSSGTLGPSGPSPNPVGTFSGNIFVVLYSTGLAPEPNIGELDSTLSNIFLSSEATFVVSGELSNTLSNISLLSEGEVEDTVFNGELDITLGDVILLDGSYVTSQNANATLNLDNIDLFSELDVVPKGSLDRLLDDILFSAEGVAPSSGVLNKTLDDIILNSFIAVEIEGNLDESIIVNLNAVAEGAGSGHLEQEIVLAMTSEGESSRFVDMFAEVLISVESEGVLSLKAELSTTLDDILSVSNDDSADLSSTLDVITLSSSGAELLTAELETVITLSVSSQGQSPLEASLTEILDDVILLQTHNLPPIPDNDNSPLLDSCPSIFIGETNATFCSRS